MDGCRGPHHLAHPRFEIVVEIRKRRAAAGDTAPARPTISRSWSRPIFAEWRATKHKVTTRIDDIVFETVTVFLWSILFIIFEYPAIGKNAINRLDFYPNHKLRLGSTGHL